MLPFSSTIRNARITDAAAISELLKQSFASYKHLYTDEGFNATTPGPDEIQNRLAAGECWICEDNTGIVGTLCCKPAPDGLYLYGMAVHPQYRNQRIAWRLLEKASVYARTIGSNRLYLSTTPFLLEAIRLYERT